VELVLHVGGTTRYALFAESRRQVAA
jgi:hypothetical protein